MCLHSGYLRSQGAPACISCSSMVQRAVLHTSADGDNDFMMIAPHRQCLMHPTLSSPEAILRQTLCTLAAGDGAAGAACSAVALCGGADVQDDRGIHRAGSAGGQSGCWAPHLHDSSRHAACIRIFFSALLHLLEPGRIRRGQRRRLNTTVAGKRGTCWLLQRPLLTAVGSARHQSRVRVAPRQA